MLKDLDIAPGDWAEVKSLMLLIEKLPHQLAGHNRCRFVSKSEGLD